MLQLKGIHKRFGQHQVLQDISFKMAKGEILALLGPSGSGKSTLLNIIAGLEQADAGRVEWDGQDQAAIPVHQRGFGFMFQDYALFPHRNVGANVAFALEMHGDSPSKINARVSEVLELVSLVGFEAREIGQLSGGEQQRVALARALAPQPKLLMLDEALGSLDRALREELGTELGRILRASQQSSIYVTHDQEEAFAIADRIVLLNEGRIVQIGSPQDLYFKPRTIFAAKFIGLENIFSADIRRKEHGQIALTPLGDFPLAEPTNEDKVSLLFRPDAMRLEDNGKHKISGKMIRKSFRGRYSELEIDVAGQKIVVHISEDLSEIIPGNEINLFFNAEDCIQILNDD